jgi:hypothetical protein
MLATNKMTENIYRNNGTPIFMTKYIFLKKSVSKKLMETNEKLSKKLVVKTIQDKNVFCFNTTKKKSSRMAGMPIATVKFLLL